MLDAAGLRTTLERMAEGLEREIQVKREELAELESSLAGARSMLKLPAVLLKSALAGQSDQAARVRTAAKSAPEVQDGQVTLRGAMREAIAALTDPFTNADVLAWAIQKYQEHFKPEQSTSVSSVMAKFHHKGLIRQVGTRQSGAVLWEKVAGRWTEKGVTG